MQITVKNSLFRLVFFSILRTQFQLMSFIKTFNLLSIIYDEHCQQLLLLLQLVLLLYLPMKNFTTIADAILKSIAVHFKSRNIATKEKKSTLRTGNKNS